MQDKMLGASKLPEQLGERKWEEGEAGNLGRKGTLSEVYISPMVPAVGSQGQARAGCRSDPGREAGAQAR